MTKSTFSLLLACGLLTACGGSGGGGNNNAATDPGSNNPAPPPATTEPAAVWQVYPAKNAPYQGVAAVLPANTFAISNANHLHSFTSTNLATPVIQGKELVTQFANIHVRGMTKLIGSSILGRSYRNFIASGSDYANSRFGYIDENGTETYIFSHGSLTTNMPNSGRVKYDGDAAIAKAGVASVADADFVADFASKRLTGSITTDDESRFAFNHIMIDAAISGNGFASAAAANVRTTGHFYGNNAIELGGVFYDANQQISGSFGARKDD